MLRNFKRFDTSNVQCETYADISSTSTIVYEIVDGKPELSYVLVWPDEKGETDVYEDDFTEAEWARLTDLVVAHFLGIK